MTLHDNVTLTASCYYQFEDHFNCAEKRKKLEERVGVEKADLIMESKNGCNNVRQKPRYTIDGIHYHRCVCAYRSSRLGIYFDLLNKLESGILPDEGAYLDQPAKILDILQRLSYIKTDMEQRNIEKAKKKAERENRVKK